MVPQAEESVSIFNMIDLRFRQYTFSLMYLYYVHIEVKQNVLFKTYWNKM